MDIVLLWVDGEDPEWLQRYRQFTGRDGNSAEFVARYRESDELRYALRSLQKYAPWLGRIFLVHDDVQRPPWLVKEHEKLKLIPHSSFIPAEFLPTFSSYAIESFVHRIPGLSEEFICTNDDTFLIRPCLPTTFFRNGKPVVYLSEFDAPTGPVSTSEPAWIQALKNAESLIGADQHPRKNVAHGFYTCTKQAAGRAWRAFPEALLRNADSRVRSAHSLAVLNHLVPHSMLQAGEAIPCELPFVRMQRWLFSEKLSTLFWHAARGVRHPTQRARYLLSHLSHPPVALCINSGPRESIKALLSEKFPQPSPFEV
ncbi:MAG: Stealth CR1 domain-containing protein [Bdellovibrionaceae bacterium]|nr:Stealth CR1 domain-containing protein [Bdellovibrionales bacterium]MCB9255310.1 Stealth CR1 domain-containing protein [Pseudobdellovibrionaceae bacterium]